MNGLDLELDPTLMEGQSISSLHRHIAWRWHTAVASKQIVEQNVGFETHCHNAKFNTFMIDVTMFGKAEAFDHQN